MGAPKSTIWPPSSPQRKLLYHIRVVELTAAGLGAVVGRRRSLSVMISVELVSRILEAQIGLVLFSWPFDVLAAAFVSWGGFFWAWRGIFASWALTWRPGVAVSLGKVRRAFSFAGSVVLSVPGSPAAFRQSLPSLPFGKRFWPYIIGGWDFNINYISRGGYALANRYYLSSHSLRNRG